MTRHAPELEKHPIFLGGGAGANVAPVTRGIDNLTTEEGDRLELMARINSPELVKGVLVANIFTSVYGSKYAQKLIDKNLRLSVSLHGAGRRDIIDVVDAGGNLPAEYYTGQSKKLKVVGIDDGANE